MRKLILTLLSSLAISVPFLGASPVQANEMQAKAGDEQAVSYYAGMIAAWRHFANFETSKALNILDQVNRNAEISSAEQELLDLMRLTIYRQEGNNLAGSPGGNERAIKYLTEAIVLDDTSAHARRRRGDAYCEAGNFVACQRDYAIAWKLTRDKSSQSLASHLSARGMAYQESGKISEGNADLRESARLYRLLGDDGRAKMYEFLIRPE